MEDPIYSSDVRTVRHIIGASIDSLTWEEALRRLAQWAKQPQGRYVCICNVHSVVTARKTPEFAKIIDSADMATADGAPVAWLMRRLGISNQTRINGPDLMWKYCEEAASRDESIFLYGSQQGTLDLLQAKLVACFPGIRIAGSFSPPFRALTEEEDAMVVDLINSSGAGTVWISLGCPKQEKWMSDHRASIQAVMIGVGAAFDYHAGTIQRAPLWMQRRALEWAYRLGSEPRRLWKRYLVTNTLFLGHATYQVFKHKAALALSALTPSFWKRTDS